MGVLDKDFWSLSLGAGRISDCQWDNFLIDELGGALEDDIVDDKCHPVHCNICEQYWWRNCAKKPPKWQVHTISRIEMSCYVQISTFFK